MGEALVVAVITSIPAFLAFFQGRSNGKGLSEVMVGANILRAKSDQIHDLVNSKMSQALLTIEAQDIKISSALNTIAVQQAEILKLQKLVAGLQGRLSQL